MTRKPDHVVIFKPEEFAHCRRALETIAVRAANLELIFEAVEKRSAEEFKAAMKIVKKTK